MKINASLRVGYDLRQRTENFHTVFPEYLDSKLSRAEGRRIPRELGVDTPLLVELRLATQKLKLEFELHAEAAYPRRAWEKRGMILIEHKMSKTKLLRTIALEIKKNIRPALERKKEELKKVKGKRRSSTKRRG